MKINSQKGMSMLGMVFTLILVASGLLLAMKIVPLYIDDYSIAKALEALNSDRGLYDLSKQSIRDKLQRKMSADYARPLGKDEVFIVKTRDTLKIDVIYEARVPVVYNLDVVGKFEHHFEQKR